MLLNGEDKEEKKDQQGAAWFYVLESIEAAKMCSKDVAEVAVRSS